MPKPIDPKEKYDYLLKWLDSDVTKLIVEGSMPGVSKAAEELKKALLAQTDDRNELALDVEEKLNAFKESIDDTSRVYSGRSGIASYLNYGSSLADYALLSYDRELESFNIIGNTHLTESFGAEGISALDKSGNPKTLPQINDALCTLGYDKLWNSMAKRVELSGRTNCTVIRDEDAQAVSDEIIRTNTELKAAVRSIQENAPKNKELYTDYDKTFAPENYIKIVEAKKNIDWQSDALGRGWDPSKADEVGVHIKIREAVKYNPKNDLIEDEYRDLRGFNKRCNQYLGKSDPTKLEFQSRKDFCQKYTEMNLIVRFAIITAKNSPSIQASLEDYVFDNVKDRNKTAPKMTAGQKKSVEDEMQRIATGKEDIDSAKEYRENESTRSYNPEKERSDNDQEIEDPEYLADRIKANSSFDSTSEDSEDDPEERLKTNDSKNSMFFALYKRDSNTKDIFSLAHSRYKNYAYSTVFLHGDEKDVKENTDNILSAVTKATSEYVMSEAVENSSTSIYNTTDKIKIFDKYSFDSDNKYMRKLNKSVKLVNMIDVVDENKENRRLSLNMTKSELDTMYMNVVRSADDLQKNEPSLYNEFNNTAINSSRKFDYIKRLRNNATVGSRSLFIYSAGEYIQDKNMMLYQALDAGTGERNHEREAIELRKWSIDQFRDLLDSFRDSDDNLDSLLEDNDNRKTNVTRAKDDKRSASYRGMISALKLLKKMRNREHFGDYTPEEIMKAFENAKKATKKYIDTHSGIYRLTRAGSPEGKERVENAREIYNDILDSENMLHARYMTLCFMPKGITIDDALEQCDDIIDEIDRGVPSDGLNKMDALAKEKGKIGVDLDGKNIAEVNINELIDKNVSAEDVYGIGSPQAAAAEDLSEIEDDEKSELEEDNNSESSNDEPEDKEEIDPEPIINENTDRKAELDHRYIANRRTIENCSENLKYHARPGHEEQYTVELEKQIRSREELLERYSYLNDPVGEEATEKVSQDITNYTAGIIAAKQLIGLIKNGKVTFDKLKEMDFNDQVESVKANEGFKSMAQGKTSWAKALSLKEKALTNNGDLLYAGFTNANARALEKKDDDIITTERKSIRSERNTMNKKTEKNIGK